MNTKTFLNKPSQLLKVGVVANLLEWYEFSLYGYLATTMGKLFLGGNTDISLLIKTWGMFAATFAARPIGSVFWGYIGDHWGHRKSLKGSLLTMAIPTIFIGLLPTYHNVGLLATLLLILCRFVQGFAAGGELPISACYIFETAPTHLRSVLCSTVTIGVGLGMLSGSLVTQLLYHYFTPEQILQGAWRIPYLLSIPLIIAILIIRRSIDQTALETATPSTKPAPFELSTQFKRFTQLLNSGFIPLVLLVGFLEVCCYVLLIWLPTYLTHFLMVSPSIAQAGNVVLLASLQGLLLLMGYVSSKVGYKSVLIAHTLLILGLTYPLFSGLQTSSFIIFLLIHAVFAWLYSGICAVMMEVLGSNYPSSIRASGMSITHTVGAGFFGGTAPIICTWLTNKTGLLMFPAYYMIIFGLIALPIILRLPLTKTSKV